MKQIATVLLFASLGLSTQVFAAARFLALCSTNDGQFTISVTESQGYPKRNTRLFAAIKDASGHYVSAFNAEIVTGENNRYGGVKYVDAATGGTQFVLSAPTPEGRGFRVDSLLTLANGTRVVDNEMQCSAFNRQLPGR